jgi:hypothetical protein
MAESRLHQERPIMQSTRITSGGRRRCRPTTHLRNRYHPARRTAGSMAVNAAGRFSGVDPKKRRSLRNRVGVADRRRGRQTRVPARGGGRTAAIKRNTNSRLAIPVIVIIAVNCKDI